MATARDVITRSLRKLKILASGETPEAQEADDCLEALNQMLAEWEIDGVDLAHIGLALDDTLDVPDSHLNGIALNLAMRIADDFGATITPSIAQEALNGKNAIVAYHWSMADLTDENPLADRNLSNGL